MEHLGTDPPRNSPCTLQRLVRLEKQVNNKLQNENVQKCRGSCWLVSCLSMGVSYAHQSCAKVLGLA